jgi:uncharacterized membrane protein
MYEFVLLAHIAGVFVLVGGLTIEAVAAIGLSRAQSLAQLRGYLFAARFIKRIMPIATVLVVIPGVWMALKGGWDWQSSWIVVAFTVTIFFSVYSPLVKDKQLEHICGLADVGRVTASELKGMAKGLLLMVWIGIANIFGILYLMVVKPGWTGSVAAVIVASAVGFGIDMALSRQPRVEAMTAR